MSNERTLILERDHITLSIFDIFKIGPGPSSSHTIGPMLAALDFVARTAEMNIDTGVKPDALTVSLYGSLASTGKGHGTHRAVLGGLLGWKPESCDCDELLALGSDKGDVRTVRIHDVDIDFKLSDVLFVPGEIDAPYQNTVDFKL
ncbi:MAG: hypothetical protein KAG97_09125, partial [Victivallales bacterium]|nr:hypothetical protein [Victivallales bacterium]